MSTLYITQQGAVLKKVSRRLTVYKGKEKIAEVPVIKVDRVMLFGNIQVTAQTVAFLLDSSVDLCYLSSKGRYRGRLAAAESKNVLLRVAQYERYLDDDFQLHISKALVEAKIKSALGLIRRYSRNYPELDFSQEVASLDNALNSVGSQTLVPSLLGIEGHATAVYFRAFGRMFRREKMSFTKRTRRPPKDPTNALLSFGYTLVTNEILSFLFAVGFDPYIGYLHSLDYGRRVQKSVFECDLDEKNLSQMIKEAIRYIDAEEDSLIIYHLCKGCLSKIESYGRQIVRKDVMIV